jgi:ParB-like chromosome segregation protein Spo0J
MKRIWTFLLAVILLGTACAQRAEPVSAVSGEETASAVSYDDGRARPSNSGRLQVKNGKLSAGHARALLAVENKDDIKAIADEVAASDMSVRQVEKLVKKAKSKPAVKKAPKQSSYYKMVEQTLSEYLGKKVSVKPLIGKNGGTLSIEFYSDDDLKDLAAKLEDKQ